MSPRGPPRGQREHSLQPTSGAGSTISLDSSPTPFGTNNRSSTSVTTLDLNFNPTESDGLAQDDRQQQQQDDDDDDEQHISLYHEIRMASEVQLKEQRRHGSQMSYNIHESLTRSGHIKTLDFQHSITSLISDRQDYCFDQNNGGGDGDDHLLLLSQRHSQQPPGRFRYLIGALIVLAVALNSYSSNTMYIAAIEMISNDVLQSGLTQLRAKHISNDPLATNRNAALPGTCPVMAGSSELEHHRHLQLLMAATLIQEGVLSRMPNASEISAHEHLVMQQDSAALHEDVEQRLASGQLVNWNIQERGYVFTAHTLGTILIAVPVSRLALIYSHKTMILICMLLGGLRMVAFSTVATRSPFWVTFLFELLIGGACPTIFLLGYPVAAAWLLPSEANFFVAINILCQTLGIAATNFVSTQLLSAGLAWHWCYDIPGFLMFLIAICWFIWGNDKPEESRFVSRAELELLQGDTIASRNASLLSDLERNESAAAATATSADGQHHEVNDETQPLKGTQHSVKQGGERQLIHKCSCPSLNERQTCPANELQRKPNWLTIFTCPTVWAIILVHFANNWTAKNATLWPTFFNNILHIDSGTIGIMLGIKGIWALLFGILFVLVTRKLVIERPFGISLTAYRRWNQAFAIAIYSASVALIVRMDCDMIANLISLLIQPVVSSFNSISMDQMPLDLSAEDSGLIMSVVRLLAIGDIVALPVSSFILSHAPDALAGDRTTWQIVWCVGLAVRLMASLYFVLVAKSRPRSYSHLESRGPCKSVGALYQDGMRGRTSGATGDRYV